MSFISSVLLFSSDAEAVGRLNEVIEPLLRTRFSLECKNLSIWHLEGNYVDFLALITLVNANVWDGTPQMLKRDEDEAGYSFVLGIQLCLGDTPSSLEALYDAKRKRYRVVA